MFTFTLTLKQCCIRRLHITKQHVAFFSEFCPKAPLPKNNEVQRLNEFVHESQQLLVLSGAGLSTESGIPDYRSKDVGLYDRKNHKPITHYEFMNSVKGRQRYWARNFLGWETFIKHHPNSAHLKLSELERIGKVHWHVTQNVDGLQFQAGSSYVTELHGCMHRVICLDCKTIFERNKLQSTFEILNRYWTGRVTGYGPDADAFINNDDVVNFKVPPCSNCGGTLKPDVTFFGDNVPLDVVAFVNQKVDKSDGVLVVGSSLHVWSGYKFIVRASERSIPIVAINVGPTRADKLLSFKINALCTKVLSQIFCT